MKRRKGKIEKGKRAHGNSGTRLSHRRIAQPGGLIVVSGRVTPKETGAYRNVVPHPEFVGDHGSSAQSVYSVRRDHASPERFGERGHAGAAGKSKLACVDGQWLEHQEPQRYAGFAPEEPQRRRRDGGALSSSGRVPQALCLFGLQAVGEDDKG